nr:ribonuclease H-like domain-containing protein [Tanacetum cinerariifolium]
MMLQDPTLVIRYPLPTLAIIFCLRQETDTAYLLLYVDIVLTASSKMLLQRIIASLHQEFSMTDLGSLNYFLGISVTRDSLGMLLSQRKNATEILERAHKEPHFSALKRILSVNRRFLVLVQRQGIVALPIVVYLSSNPVQHQRRDDIYFVRDLVVAGQVRVLHVSSHYQYENIFTKGFPYALFEKLRTSLSLRCPPALTVGEC